MIASYNTALTRSHGSIVESFCAYWHGQLPQLPTLTCVLGNEYVIIAGKYGLYWKTQPVV
ncbi:MAG: hypothetical protein WCJ81_03305 [bacterium]